MALCSFCQQERATGSSCTANHQVRMLDGRMFETVVYTGARCVTCEVTGGGRHHIGCDQEVCPYCRRQLIACDCQPPDRSVVFGD